MGKLHNLLNHPVHGMPECEFEQCRSDEEKVRMIMSMINERNASVDTMKHIGIEAPNKVRPLLVSVPSMSIRNRIVDQAQQQQQTAHGQYPGA